MFHTVYVLPLTYSHATEQSNKADNKYRQDGQCTHNVTLRRVRATIVAAETNCITQPGVCICSLSYPAWDHLWPAPLYHTFPNYLINGTIFEKKKEKLLNTKCVFWFSPQLLSETFPMLWRNERDVIKNVHWSSCKVSFIFFLVRF